MHGKFMQSCLVFLSLQKRLVLIINNTLVSTFHEAGFKNFEILAQHTWHYGYSIF